MLWSDHYYEYFEDAKKGFLDRWLKHSENEKQSGMCDDCSYWDGMENNVISIRDNGYSALHGCGE